MKISGQYNDLLVKNLDLTKIVRLVLWNTEEIQFLANHGKRLKSLRYCKIDFMKSLFLNEFLTLRLDRILPTSVKLDKLELYFNSLKVSIPTPLSDILR